MLFCISSHGQRLSPTKLIGTWVQDDGITKAIITAKTITYQYRDVTRPPIHYQIKGDHWYEEGANVESWHVELNRFNDDELIFRYLHGNTEVWHRVKQVKKHKNK